MDGWESSILPVPSSSSCLTAGLQPRVALFCPCPLRLFTAAPPRGVRHSRGEPWPAEAEESLGNPSAHASPHGDDRIACFCPSPPSLFTCLPRLFLPGLVVSAAMIRPGSGVRQLFLEKAMGCLLLPLSTPWNGTGRVISSFYSLELTGSIDGVDNMAEAPRHSVDIPLSKTLVALKRVRSLRDPSTNSMSKFTSVIEHMNIGANSLNVPFEMNDSNKHHVLQSGKYHLKEEIEDFLSNSGSNFSSRIPNLNSTFPEKSCAVKIRGSKPTRTKLAHKSHRDRPRKSLASARVRHSTRHVEVEVDSYKAPEFDLADRVTATGKKPFYRNSRKPASAVSHAESPCKSVSEAHTTGSRRPAMGFATLDSQSKSNDVVGSNFSGCGISYCWSGTPKYRGRNIYSDDEEQEKPLLSAEHSETACINSARYPQSPRSLSQKFRPKSFNELVGLNVVSQSLLLAITKGKISPMYLFHGPHGNGKTSTARVFAAALNCLSDVELRPCGFCRECVFLFSGRSRNIKELDAAKINHKERFKALQKNTSVVPCSSRFEVFIIEECQSLREEAWATIFKSLDELPGRAVYVMITSDLDTLPHSYVSRCQRYHFPKIKEVDIIHRLQKISIEEELEFDMDALDFIATKSNGSLRDAETMLDQLALLGKRITVSLTNELVRIQFLS
ncbi:hypothetical protein GW17_00013493 [Ensete ventricosum]|nr:hypothetical protein GW17_00013493 [Ensete ventricosum]